ncbi:6-phospho-beta-glucosidase [Alicyclobacillus sp. SO9]|nr:6-phospho-beta-glucosidase [Alicyclobacillus sp. SO9]
MKKRSEDVSRQSIKVAVIGGGSSYTPEFIDGLIQNYSEFPVKEVVLVDVDEGKSKLETVTALAQRMVATAGVPIQISSTLNRREAILGADFVTTQLRVGQLQARVIDEQIPLRYGCIGQETTGAGGFSNALRTIPVILDVCADIEELAPEAFLLNFTNPAGIVTQAVQQYTNVKCIGLCNLPINTQMQIAKMLNVKPEEVNTETIGINHLHWITKVLVQGVDRTQDILNLLSTGTDGDVANIPDLAWDQELLQSLGAIPCSYLRYYYMADEVLVELQKDYESTGTRGQVVQKIERELFERYQDENLTEKPKELEQRGGAYYSLVAVNLMTSIHQNRRDIQTVNVQNNGVIPFLPDDSTVEVNCVIDSGGAHPVQLSQPVSPAIRGLLQVVKAYEDLTVQAAVTGDTTSALNALTIHPLVPSFAVAKKLLQALLDAHGQWLQQFQ